MAEKDRMSVIKELPATVTRSFREVKAELKKVVWPTPKQLATSTAAVIASCLVIGGLIWGFDTILSFILEKLIFGQ